MHYVYSVKYINSHGDWVYATFENKRRAKKNGRAYGLGGLFMLWAEKV